MTLRAQTRLAALGLAALLALILLPASCFAVREGEQAIITQFGEPRGEPIVRAGLYFKTPFIQEVHRLEKRILEWDGEANLIPTRDKTFIFVDATARWRIVDPLKFYKSVVTELGARGRLDDVLDGATRDAVSAHDLIESVRLTSRRLPQDKETEGEADTARQPEIQVGRLRIQERIKEEASSKLADFGILLVDVRIKRINYSDQVQQKVYDRMISERRRIAEKFLSEGQGRRSEIEGEREKELRRIRSEAYKRAQEVQGAADAQAAAIYAESFGKDTEFYRFLRSLEVLRSALGGRTRYIGTTSGELWRYLKGMEPAGEKKAGSL